MSIERGRRLVKNTSRVPPLSSFPWLAEKTINAPLRATKPRFIGLIRRSSSVTSCVARPDEKFREREREIKRVHPLGR